MTVHRLRRRLDALYSTQDFKPWCRDFADDGDDADEVVARHIAAGACEPDCGGHFVVRFVAPKGG